MLAYLASIPYQWHVTGDLSRYKAWYAGQRHMCFRAIGVDVSSENASSRGRANMAVLTGGQVFVFVFTMAEKAQETEAALEVALVTRAEPGLCQETHGP